LDDYISQNNVTAYLSTCSIIFQTLINQSHEYSKQAIVVVTIHQQIYLRN